MPKQNNPLTNYLSLLISNSGKEASLAVLVIKIKTGVTLTRPTDLTCKVVEKIAGNIFAPGRIDAATSYLLKTNQNEWTA